MSSLLRKYPILVNLVIIILVAILGILIANFSLAIFTKHGEYSVVPSVEKMSYSSAIDQLHAEGFKVEISDSVFRDDLRPGYVLEQNPTANSKVKPGRTVYLVINAVNAKQVAINNIEGISLRQGKAMLQGLGFKDKNIKVVYRLGKHENLIQSVRVDGKKLRPGQRVPVSSVIVLEVSDGRVGQLTD
ncbi:MAG: PASTA domain-containing protein, partial [Muribaculaceae bacterium]|nr:PASTA domain-containing protein [Muribaculaceae bacterium]